MRYLEVELRIACDRVWVLSRERCLIPVEARFEPPWAVGRVFVTAADGRLKRWELPWAGRISIRHGAGVALILVVLRNAEACGLSHWAPGKLADPPGEFRLAVFQHPLDELDDCLWLEPYPRGAPAALCLTDHPDFDTVERGRLLADLLGSLDLRITKGVFPAGDPKGAKMEPGLDDPGYAAIARDLDAAGSEIAFHGMGPRYRAPSIEECRRRAERMRPFRPATWIDHGTGAYLFSREGVLEGGIALTRFLAEFGVVNYWSYVDIWQNPTFAISSQVRRGDGDAVRDFARSSKAALRSPAGLLELPYGVSHLANNLFGEIGALAFRRAIWSRDSRQRAAGSRRLHRALAQSPETIYGLDGCSFASTRQEIWCFDTILMNYPATALGPEQVDGLRRESGLCLAHSYLCDVRHAGTGGAFERDRAGGTRLNPRFVEDLGYVSRLQREGDLVVLPFRELRRTLMNFAAARLERRDSGWGFSESTIDRSVVVAGRRSAIERLRCGEGAKSYRGEVGYVRLDVDRETALRWC